MFYNDCYLIKFNQGQELEEGKILCKTDKTIAQTLYMPVGRGLIWVTENKAKQIYEEYLVKSSFRNIKAIKKLYVLKKPEKKAGQFFGYINIEDFRNLNKNSLRDTETKEMIYLTDYYSAIELYSQTLPKSISKQERIDKATTYIKNLQFLPLKHGYLDFEHTGSQSEPKA